MKLLYLGTAAAEGIPAVFCSCPTCLKARKLKGKDIRTRSQALLDDKILFDFPADSYSHYITSDFTGSDLPAIRHLFITHSHMDHFYPDELDLRRPVFVLSEPIETLHIYGNLTVKKILHDLQKTSKSTPCNDFRYAKPFEPIEFDGYRVRSLPAFHDRQEECLFYSLEHGGKAMLYAHDTGMFPKPVWEYFLKAKPRFNLVSLDCTSMTNREGSYHMGLPDCVEVRERLVTAGTADGKTLFVLNHFSHGGGLNHDDLRKVAEAEGFMVSYDGMEIDVP